AWRNLRSTGGRCSLDMVARIDGVVSMVRVGQPPLSPVDLDRAAKRTNATTSDNSLPAANLAEAGRIGRRRQIKGLLVLDAFQSDHVSQERDSLDRRHCPEVGGH